VAGRGVARLSPALALSAGGSVLVSPPVAPTLDVFALRLAEIGRTDDEDLKSLWPCLVASPGTG